MVIGETRSVRLTVDSKPLEGRFTSPKHPIGLALFVTGTAGARHASFAVSLADRMHEFRFATYLMDLVSPAESDDRSVRVDVERLCERLDIQFNWLNQQGAIESLPVVVFGLDTGAAAAAELLPSVQCNPDGLAFLNGRLDLIDSALSGLDIPLLFFVDTAHDYLLDANKAAYEQVVVDEHKKSVLHDVDREAVPIVTHWARSRVTDGGASTTNEERTDSRHGVF